MGIVDDLAASWQAREDRVLALRAEADELESALAQEREELAVALGLKKKRAPRTPVKEPVAAYLKEHPGASAAEVAKALGLNASSVRKALRG